MSGGGRLISDIVDAVVLLVRLTIGADHWSLISFAGVTIFLEMTFLFAVPALSVWVVKRGRAIVAALVVAVVTIVAIAVVIAISAEANCGELSELVIG